MLPHLEAPEPIERLRVELQKSGYALEAGAGEGSFGAFWQYLSSSFRLRVSVDRNLWILELGRREVDRLFGIETWIAWAEDRKVPLVAGAIDAQVDFLLTHILAPTDWGRDTAAELRALDRDWSRRRWGRAFPE